MLHLHHGLRRAVWRPAVDVQLLPVAGGDRRRRLLHARPPSRSPYRCTVDVGDSGPGIQPSLGQLHMGGHVHLLHRLGGAGPASA